MIYEYVRLRTFGLPLVAETKCKQRIDNEFKFKLYSLNKSSKMPLRVTFLHELHAANLTHLH